MKAVIYDPYLDTMGGGERYTLSVARALVDLGYEVDLLWDDEEILKILGKRFGMETEGVRARPNFFTGGFWRKRKEMSGYDLSFFVSDGSIPFLFARKNMLHFQVPFSGVRGGGMLAGMKFKKINWVVCNSELTKKIIDREYGIKSTVLYPPIAVDKFRPGEKEDLILSVGRFSQLKQAKRQDILIEAFRQMVDGGFSGWRLVLAGGSEVGKGKFFEKLMERARGYEIEIIENPDFSKIKDLYGKARVFWSAAGYGVDEESEPEKLEHFGMAVVEGMAAGVVPVVYWAGGHKEIVRRGESGEGWRTVKELEKITEDLARDREKWRMWSKAATTEAKRFSENVFRENLKRLLQEG